MAAPAHAEDRDYCPNRPGLGTPACTIAPGHVSLETSLADWTRNDDPDTREDTVLIGDTLVRIGVSEAIEAQLGWTPFGHDRTRDKATGEIDQANRVGDVTLGLKANLRHPDGKGFSVAVQPYVTLPVGRRPIGAGDWAAGMLVPVTYDVSDAINLQFTPEADAAVDQDGQGRHLAYSATLGLGASLSHALTATAELENVADEDPSDHTHQLLADLSLAAMATADLQLDVGGVAGLHGGPSVRIYAGIARRF